MLRTEKIILQKNPNTMRINLMEIDLSKAGESKTKANQRQNLTKKNNNNNSYKLLIKKIAYQLKKRTKLPKCKIFKFYLSYRILIMRIAKRLKSTAKKLNFWDKNDTEMTLQEVDQIQEIASTACKLIQNQGKKNQKKKNIASSGRKKKKSPKVKMSLLKKSEEEKKDLMKRNNNKNKSNDKTTILLNDLKKIELNKKDMDNFVKKFNKFLNDNDIEIMRENKLPNFSNKENEYLLTQKDFWIKYIIYVSNKYKNELNLFNFINFIEQFFLWCNPEGDNMDFVVEIKLQIHKIFDEEKINKFLLSNKLSNLDQLFERYKIFNSKESNKENYVEAKIDLENCTCPTCTEKGYIQKVIEYNLINNQITFAKKNNLSFSPFSDNSNNYIKFERDKTLHNSGEINIEYSILSENKYNDNDIFSYLNKIEKGKAESERKKKRYTSSKKKPRNNNSNKNSVKKEQKENKKEKVKEIKEKKEKKGKNEKVNAILDLMGLEADSESDDTASFNKK